MKALQVHVWQQLEGMTWVLQCCAVPAMLACLSCAAAALPHMMGVLNSRPAMFQSVQAAAEWAVRSGICKNKELAGLSLPSQLKQVSLRCSQTDKQRCLESLQVQGLQQQASPSTLYA
jgi:hypothetical protein